MTGYVYFIKPVGQDGPIKVGHSVFPPHRLQQLQTWSPVELEIVSSFKASLKTETDIHERFAKWQVRGEWFEPVKELVDLAEGIRAGRKLEDLTDLSVKTGKLTSRPNTKRPLARIVGGYKHRVEMARQHVNKETGHSVWVPSEVTSILNSAGGYRQEYRELTQDEISILEKFIADCRDPAKLEELRSKAAAA